MGFVRLNCAVCEGKGYTEGSSIPGVLHKITCLNCNGEGSFVTHTGAIGSYQISVDPAPREGEATWATLWQCHDDGTLEIRDSGIVPIEPKKE